MRVSELSRRCATGVNSHWRWRLERIGRQLGPGDGNSKAAATTANASTGSPVCSDLVNTMLAFPIGDEPSDGIVVVARLSKCANDNPTPESPAVGRIAMTARRSMVDE